MTWWTPCQPPKTAGSVNSWADFISATETREVADDVEVASTCDADPGVRHVAEHRLELDGVPRRHRDERAGARLGEERRERVERVALGVGADPVEAVDRHADTVAHARLGERDGQATLGQVVGRLDDTGRGRPRRGRRPSACSAARSTFGGRPPRCSWTTCAHSDPSSSSRVVAEEVDVRVVAAEAGAGPLGRRRP